VPLFPLRDAQGNQYPARRFARVLTVLVAESALLVAALYLIAWVWQSTH
jgi:hypothetical protein